MGDPANQPNEDVSLLLDRIWEDQQKKTFLAWCNSHLRKVRESVESMEESWKDGKKLIKLLEVLSGENLGHLEKGNLRVHKISNINKALAFLNKRVKLVNVGAEEICDGNQKVTLGVIWTVILRFAITDMDGKNVKEGLLMWCKRCTKPYDNVKISDFHDSWKDGLGFCALIHRHRPELIDYHNLNKDDPLGNLQLAFDVAEKHLDITKMLQASDVHKNPEEKSVFTYLTAYYAAFASSKQAEKASKSIQNIINLNKESEEMIQSYENLGSQLLNWINKNILWLSDTKVQVSSLDELKNLTDIFDNHKNYQKPPKADEKGKLENNLISLQTRRRLHSKPPYIPPEHLDVDKINAAWEHMNRLEKEYDDWLRKLRKDLEDLDDLIKKFNFKCDVQNSWSSGKIEKLVVDDYSTIDNITEITALLKKCEAFNAEMDAQQKRIQTINEILSLIRALNYKHINILDDRAKNVNYDWSSMVKAIEFRKYGLEERFKLLQNLDNIRLDFARKAQIFIMMALETCEDLSDSYRVRSVFDVEELIARHKTFVASFPSNESSLKELEELNDSIEKITLAENPYTSLTVQELKNHLDKVKKESAVKLEKLNKDKQVHLNNEALIKSYDLMAVDFENWKNSILRKVDSIHKNTNINLEQQLENLHKLMSEVDNHKKVVDGVLDMEANIKANKGHAYPAATIISMYQQLRQGILGSIQDINNQIATIQSRNLSKEVIDEMQRSFRHFDRNNDGLLEIDEFRQYLISQSIDAQKDEDFNKILDSVVKTNGRVSLAAFMDYVSQMNKSEDGLKEIFNAFKVLSGGKDYILPEQLKKDLPPEVAEVCIKRMLPYNGPDAVPNALDFSSFSNSLFGVSDL